MALTGFRICTRDDGFVHSSSYHKGIFEQMQVVIRPIELKKVEKLDEFNP